MHDICVGRGGETFRTRSRQIMPSGIYPRRPFWERFWSYVQKTDSCWLWTAYIDRGGYGRIALKGRMRWAHRMVMGDIPPGYQVDHLCRVRACVNPAHLELVTSKENTLRGESPSAKNSRKKQCKYGHAFTPENTGKKHRGERYCKQCSRASCKAYYHRNKRLGPYGHAVGAPARGA